MKRDFLTLDGLSRAELDEILHLSARLKRDLKAGQRPPLLGGKTLAMIFEKPSLRTRVTFEVGMTQLGGYAVYLTPTDIRLGERESVADIARNLERWVDFIMARVFAHATITELATDPPLTSVRQPIEEMGREMTRLLIDSLAPKGRVARRLILATELVVRASSGGDAAAD